jgi:hypothetical protein
MARIVTRAALNSNSSTALEQPGKLFVDYANGNVYKYIRAEDAALANGDSVEFSDTSGYEVTNDRSGGSSIGRRVAGVAVGTITDAYYGWIQVSGRHTAVKTDGGVVKGDKLVPHASVDGRADTEANGSTVTVTSGQVFGVALATDSGTTSAGTVVAMINCL